MLLQAWVGLAVAAGVLALAWHVGAVLRERGIQSGFAFLGQSAGFDISESLLPFDASAPLWRAFVVGALNTLKVALPGMVLALVCGSLLGLGRLSRNALLRQLCAAYVELFRNIPLLLQLVLGYVLLTTLLPEPAQAWQLHTWAGPVYLSKNGLGLPYWDAALGWQAPQLAELGWQGGAALSPEYLALLLGLSAYTAAFVAEVVRAGVQAVPRGQIEAGLALGLSPGQLLRRITLPQALRVMVPPLTNQFLNLSKNASLAVAIGYPELVSVANTALNQTGQALECIALIMVFYFALSLLTVAVMGQLNRRVLRAG